MNVRWKAKHFGEYVEFGHGKKNIEKLIISVNLIGRESMEFKAAYGILCKLQCGIVHPLPDDHELHARLSLYFPFRTSCHMTSTMAVHSAPIIGQFSRCILCTKRANQ